MPLLGTATTSARHANLFTEELSPIQLLRNMEEYAANPQVLSIYSLFSRVIERKMRWSVS